MAKITTRCLVALVLAITLTMPSMPSIAFADDAASGTVVAAATTDGASSATAAASGESASSAAGGVSTAASAVSASTAISAVDTSATGDVKVSEDAQTALETDAAFGISKFSRLIKGTNKEYSSQYYGYRYQMSSQDAFSAVVIDQSTVLVYLNPDVLSSLGLSIDDAGFQQTF